MPVEVVDIEDNLKEVGERSSNLQLLRNTHLAKTSLPQTVWINEWLWTQWLHGGSYLDVTPVLMINALPTITLYHKVNEERDTASSCTVHPASVVVVLSVGEIWCWTTHQNTHRTVGIYGGAPVNLSMHIFLFLLDFWWKTGVEKSKTTFLVLIISYWCHQFSKWSVFRWCGNNSFSADAKSSCCIIWIRNWASLNIPIVGKGSQRDTYVFRLDAGTEFDNDDKLNVLKHLDFFSLLLLKLILLPQSSFISSCIGKCLLQHVHV